MININTYTKLILVSCEPRLAAVNCDLILAFTFLNVTFFTELPENIDDGTLLMELQSITQGNSSGKETQFLNI